MRAEFQLMLTGATACLAAGAWLAWHGREHSRTDRAIRAVTPLAIVAVALVAWAAFRLVPHWTWSAARLAGSMRIALGIPLYTGPHDPGVNGWIYGPVSAIGYLPATLASDPLTALRLAAALNAFYFVLPLLVLLGGSLAFSTDGWRSLLLFGFGLAALLAPFATWYGAAALSSDTIAIALGVSSCILLARHGGPVLPALLFSLAAWTKQIEAPLLLAQFIYLAKARGMRPALVYTGWCAAGLVVLALLFSTWFGAGNLWHCMIGIPRRHPINLTSAGSLLVAFAGATWWVWPIAGVTWRWAPRDSSERPPSFQTGMLLLLSSIVLLPGGIAAAAKAGGDQNSIHSIAYAILGGVALCAAWLSSPSIRAANLARLGLIGATAAALAFNLHRIFAHDHLALANPGEQHREAFAFARSHPGQVYFPCNPLITLMADRRNYPFDYGYYDWRLAAAAPSAEEIRRQLPPTITFLVYHEKDPSHEMLRVLPEFNQLRQSGPWDIYSRANTPPVINP